MMVENGLVQKIVGLVLKSLRKSRTQEIDHWGQIGEVGYDSALKKKSWTLSHEVAWKGKRLTHFS